MTDEELVVLARQGDADAFDQLVVRHQPAVYRAAFTALRNAADAEEASQDALVRAWSRLSRFRGDAAFRTWLLAIAWNCALSRRRRVISWLRRSAPLEDVKAAPEWVGPHQEASDGQLRAHVSRAIEQLTPKLRDALLLASSGDYDYGEIGQMLGIPVGTVKWRVSDARRQVRERLAALGYLDAR